MNEIIDTFMIPEELAKKLSDLLVTQSIRERLLTNLIGKPEYDQVERSLIDIISQIDTLKNVEKVKNGNIKVDIKGKLTKDK